MRKRNCLVLAAGSFCFCIVGISMTSAQQRGRDDSVSQQSARDAYDARTSRGQPNVTNPRAASRGGARDFNGAGQNDRYTARRATADYGEHAQTDQQLAAWLLVDNRGEIALAQLAQEKTSNSDVREFAQHLIDDHSKMVENLERFAGGRRRSRGGDNRTTGSRGAQGAMPDEFAAGGQMRSAGGLNITRLKQQLGQQCLASAKRELEQKDDNEFDECFIGMQIAKHMEMIDTLKVFSHYASENLDQVIEEAEQASQEHLDHAKELIKQLTSGGQHGAAHSSSSGDRGSAGERTANRTRTSDTEKRDTNKRSSTDRESDQ